MLASRPTRRTTLLTFLLASLATVVTPTHLYAQNPGDYPRQDPNQRRDQRRDGDDRRDRRGPNGDRDRVTILPRDQAGPLFPATVFYRGQSAPIQARNSAGLRLRGDRLVLAAVVDTSGYSTAVAQTYQAYLITEVALRMGNNTLPPGAYGFGFVEHDQMVVLDLGGNELFRTPTQRAPELTRPTPLQILPDPSSLDRARLFLGRSFVVLSPA